MSSTNRGAKRIEADCYPTPLTAFAPLLPYLPAHMPIWEPACGDGRLIRAMNEYPGLQASGDDIENGYDFLADGDLALARVALVTNPPFSLAFEFCQHAVKHSPDVFLLLRLNFLASKRRQAWFRANEPAALFVLSERPKFVRGTSDSCDYAWFYWGPRHKGIFHL